MEKTFREVIADIRKGEVWENKENRIARIYINEKGNLTFEGNDNSFCINYSTCVGIDNIYVLKRKEYAFAEAFEALEEGKEIESCATKIKFKVVDEELKILNSNAPELMFNYFSYKEIKNNWYIN